MGQSHLAAVCAGGDPRSASSACSGLPLLRAIFACALCCETHQECIACAVRQVTAPTADQLEGCPNSSLLVEVIVHISSANGVCPCILCVLLTHSGKRARDRCLQICAALRRYQEKRPDLNQILQPMLPPGRAIFMRRLKNKITAKEKKVRDRAAKKAAKRERKAEEEALKHDRKAQVRCQWIKPSDSTAAQFMLSTSFQVPLPR